MFQTTTSSRMTSSRPRRRNKSSGWTVGVIIFICAILTTIGWRYYLSSGRGDGVRFSSLFFFRDGILTLQGIRSIIISRTTTAAATTTNQQQEKSSSHPNTSDRGVDSKTGHTSSKEEVEVETNAAERSSVELTASGGVASVEVVDEEKEEEEANKIVEKKVNNGADTSSSNITSKLSTTTTTTTTENNNDVSVSSENTQPTTVPSCGIWLAASTIPNAGLGMYAGRDYKKHEMLQESGDVAIPVVDIRLHTGDSEFTFLWDEYTWNAEQLSMDGEGYSDITTASPGFGAAANCFMPLQNVEEWNAMYDSGGLHRSKDPGAGAFSPWWNRTTTAYKDIHAGEEFFVNYGEPWFTGRPHFGPIPLTNDLNKANSLLTEYRNLRNSTFSRGVKEAVIDQVWDTFVKRTVYVESRVIGAFNHSDAQEFPRLVSGSENLTDIRVEQSTRSQEWLEKHGTCGDHIRSGKSTIEQAGRGAFTSRFLPNGTIVSHLPLIHITKRERLEMYKFRWEEGHPKPDRELGLLSKQLLLNYCFGHRHSTLLLCPYSPMSSFVNHNQTRANVKLQWSDPSRGNHMPHLLQTPLDVLENDWTAKLAMDLVATRDLEPGEEVFLDYSDEWEAAWQKYVETWEPVQGAESYISAGMFNEDKSKPFPTEFELIENPIIPNLEVWCNNAYLKTELWQTFYANGTIDKFSSTVESQIYPCDILRNRQGENGDLYTAVMWHENKDTGEMRNMGKLVEVPREAFKYYDRPYTSDTLLEHTFRHDARIPDDIFPAAWKNLLPPSLTKHSHWLNDADWKNKMKTNFPVRTQISVKRADQKDNKQIKITDTVDPV